MAGGEDYIPIRTALVDDPDVLWIAQKIRAKDPDLVVGKLVRFWSWAARVTADGRLGPYTAAHIDTRVVGCKGFCEALKTFRSDRKETGWLSQDPQTGELVIPKWDEWMSDSAKARAGESVRKRIHRREHRIVVLERDMPDECPDIRPEDCPDIRLDQAEQSRVEQSSREQKGTACLPEQAERESRPPRALPAAEEARQRLLCSMLLAGLPGIDRKAAAAIVARRGVSEPLVAWALERTADEQRLREGGPDRILNPVGYCRSLIENEKPPQGWVEQYNRRKLAEAAARLKEQSALKHMSLAKAGGTGSEA